MWRVLPLLLLAACQTDPTWDEMLADLSPERREIAERLPAITIADSAAHLAARAEVCGDDPRFDRNDVFRDELRAFLTAGSLPRVDYAMNYFDHYSLAYFMEGVNQKYGCPKDIAAFEDFRERMRRFVAGERQEAPEIPEDWSDPDR